MLLGEVWAQLQPQTGQTINAPIPIDAAILAMPLASIEGTIRQLEMSMGRLGLSTDQDRTWRSLTKKFSGEGLRVILQLLARAQQACATLAALCEALEKSNGDMVQALGSL
jgi:hypothetical protein